MKRIKISTYAKQNDLSYKTVYEMVKSGKISSHRTPSGTYLIDVPEDVVVDTTKEKDILLDTLMLIISSFCGKLYGYTINSQKIEKIANILKNDA